MRRCDRSGAHEPVLRLAHDVLETLSGDESGPARAVFEAKDAVTVITEHMQMCRDRFELMGAAARTLANLCGDARRAEAVARAECGRVTRRVQGICEILGNTLAARRHRRLAHERGSPEGAPAAFAETRSLRALEATVRSMRALVARLERCEGETVCARARAFALGRICVRAGSGRLGDPLARESLRARAALGAPRSLDARGG